MSLFGKQTEETTSYCRHGNRDTESPVKTKAATATGASVKILGSGCARCNALEAAAKAALAKLDMDSTVDHVTDFSEIAAYGVMATPALVVDGKVVSQGRVLSASEIAQLLQNRNV